MSILTLGSFGFMGRFFSNVLRFFVGQTFTFLAIILLGLGIYLILKGDWPSLRDSKVKGGALLFTAWLVFLHSRWFAPIMNESINSIVATWRFFWPQFITNSIGTDIGGGMIGSIFFSISYFLFSVAGTYLMIIMLVFFGIMTFFQVFLTDSYLIR